MIKAYIYNIHHTHSHQPLKAQVIQYLMHLQTYSGDYNPLQLLMSSRFWRLSINEMMKNIQILVNCGANIQDICPKYVSIVDQNKMYVLQNLTGKREYIGALREYMVTKGHKQ